MCDYFEIQLFHIVHAELVDTPTIESTVSGLKASVEPTRHRIIVTAVAIYFFTFLFTKKLSRNNTGVVENQ